MKAGMATQPCQYCCPWRSVQIPNQYHVGYELTSPRSNQAKLPHLSGKPGCAHRKTGESNNDGDRLLPKSEMSNQRWIQLWRAINNAYPFKRVTAKYRIAAVRCPCRVTISIFPQHRTLLEALLPELRKLFDCNNIRLHVPLRRHRRQPGRSLPAVHPMARRRPALQLS